MFKNIFFLWRRPGMDREEFIDYYENVHTANNARYRPPSLDYRRNYPLWDDPMTTQNPVGLNAFDSMTENRYSSPEGFAAVVRAASQPPGLQGIAEDEERFIRREARLMFGVEDHGAWDVARPDYEERARRNETARFKFLVFVAKSETDSEADFIKKFESACVPELSRVHADSIDYARNYLLFDNEFSITGVRGTPEAGRRNDFPYAVIEELWYASREEGAANLAARAANWARIAGLAGCSAYAPVVVVEERRTPRPQPTT